MASFRRIYILKYIQESETEVIGLNEIRITHFKGPKTHSLLTLYSFFEACLLIY